MQALSKYNMTPEQWQILSILDESNKALSQSEIVLQISKDKHTVSRIINRLDRDGWITKQGSNSDKRLTIIDLTKKSRSLLSEMQKKLSDHFDLIFKKFGKDKHDNLLEQLKILREILGD